MKLYRTRFGLRSVLMIVALCAVLTWALKVRSGSRPVNLYAGWLDRESVGDRMHAAGELASLEAEAVGAISRLSRSLADDPSFEVRQASAMALSRIAEAANDPSPRDEAIAALLKALEDPESDVRAEAARGLGRLVPKPEPVLEPLLRAARDPEGKVRGHAVHALGLIQSREGRNLPEIQRAIVVAINEQDFHVREMGIYSYWLAAEVDPSISARLLAAPDVLGRRAAVSALARSSIAASDAVPSLVAALTDEDREVRLGAVRSLGNLGTRSHGIREALLDATQGEDREVGRAASRVLGLIQAPAAPVGFEEN